MKRLIFAGMLVLITTAAQAQAAYTTLGPAGAGGYRSSTQRDNYSTTGNVNPNTGRRRQRNPQH
jgi:Spy/CpxP family protein refolding chaperone